ncbi:MAG: RAMP superfamily CRISPR-associated protein [Candidatus Accumulibacter sp.]|nr:RAMP superfamily CRISPR-associated protein [Accumulibacter sp.]
MNIDDDSAPCTSPTQDRTIPPAMGTRRKRANLLPLWRIQGTFTLLTPLALGTGEDEPSQEHRAPDDEHPASFIPAVARDGNHQPYLPASSIKGALRAMAVRLGFDEPTIALFGSAKPNDLVDPRPSTADRATPAQPGALEIRNAYLSDAALPASSSLPDYAPDRGTALLPHVVIDRHTGTAQDGPLYHQQVVPAKVSFGIDIIARGLDESSVRTVLSLLHACSDQASGFSLGGNSSRGHGRVKCKIDQLRQLSAFSHLMQEDTADLWSGAEKVQLQPNAPARPPENSLALDNIELRFHTPFMVHQRIPDSQRNKGDPTGKPRLTNRGRGILPASGLHGALRSQAERILRTLGANSPSPHEVEPVYSLAEAAGKLDAVAILFGASGWRGVLQCSDFVAVDNTAKLTHHMLAIDRITGGGKDSAKFSLDVLDCPTLKGSLRLDIARLRAVSDAARRQRPESPSLLLRVLGLLARVLRDLDEGDIPLGYGAAKGYGASHSATEKMLDDALAAMAADSPSWPRLSEVLKTWTDTWSAAVQSHPANPAPKPSPQNVPPPITPGEAAGEFHNPYAFLPFPKLRPKDADLPWAGYQATCRGTNHHSHVRYAPETFSGRILCQLRTTTPLFIGAGDTPGDSGNAQPKPKLNFRLNGELALPATSLRGMLSSLHESISSSAMRVMDNRSYSVRQDMGGDAINAYGSSAIGRIVIGGDGEIRLMPLTLPTLAAAHHYSLPSAFSKCYPADGHGVTWVFSKVLLEPKKLRLPAGSDYQKCEKAQFSTPAARDYWYVPLEPLCVVGHRPTSDFFREKNGYAIGQVPLPVGKYPLSAAEYKKLQQTDPELAKTYVRGWLRIMGHPDRELPPGRKFELFVPYPVELDDYEPYTLPVLDSALERFAQLSVERYAAQEKERPADVRLHLPFSPINADRDPDQPLAPKDGDLVYFKPASDGESIAEISYSALWRGRLEIAKDTSVRAYKTIDGLPADDDGQPKQALAPLQPTDRRTLLSPSEILFGFVQDQQNTKETSTLAQRRAKPAKMFKSKVRIGFGIAASAVEWLPPVTLKILASPKPPSASMYFKSRQQKPDRPISRDKLAGAPDQYQLQGRKAYPEEIRLPNFFIEPDQYQLQGRKAYLHALRTPDGKAVQHLSDHGKPSTAANALPPWQTRDKRAQEKQKAEIRPIRTQDDNPFFFPIDFINLSLAELQTLCAMLLPTPDFEHKLGMGKPIGLGSVKIEPVGLYLIDRLRRYTQDGGSGTDSRYHRGWQSPSLSPEKLPPQCLALPPAGTAGFDDQSLDPSRLAQAHMTRLARDEPALYRAIALLGNPKAVKKPVHYPQDANQRLEDQSYQWFVNNGKAGAGKQALSPFNETSTALPGLKRSS